LLKIAKSPETRSRLILLSGSGEVANEPDFGDVEVIGAKPLIAEGVKTRA
jgi:hypothetical protein